MDDTPAGQLEHAREQARVRLADAYARDILDQDQLDERLEAVERALTLAELDAVTAVLGPTALVPVAPATPAPIDAPQQLRVLFSAVDRTGAWTVAARTRVRVLFGGATLDLRQAVLPPGPIELDLWLVFGSLDIIIPPGWQLDDRCGAILGAVEHHGGPAPAPTGRVLRLAGRVVFSSLTIHERLPGESERDARKRRKRERRGRAGGPALPAADD